MVRHLLWGRVPLVFPSPKELRLSHLVVNMPMVPQKVVTTSPKVVPPFGGQSSSNDGSPPKVFSLYPGFFFKTYGFFSKPWYFIGFSDSSIQKMAIQIIILFSLILSVLSHPTGAAQVGVCYGRIATNLPPPSAVINLLKSNGISRVRVFNPDPDALAPFYGTKIELMIGVPNEILPMLANGTIATSLQWLQWNIFSHVAPNQVRYLAVGNEILLKQPFYMPYLVPAILNLYQAIQTLGLSDIIKLSSSHAATILSNSYPPSAGAFDPNLGSVMVPLLRFLHDTNSPLMVNVYPFFSYINNHQYVTLYLFIFLFRSSTVEVDQDLAYTNMFDATIDAFVYAMEREGFYGIPVVVTETGWPTAGGIDAAGADNALAYNGNVVMRALTNVGTPKRPGVGVEVYLFDLFDENGKSGGEYEKHFGIFGVDGIKAYDIRFN
ncbi:hypothetical protein DH2020_043183 [Rehmannia glutinosa]|uniref:Glucan endo-1,3-beta-D-glucosidase n=1 Tax=Rehmannia glutinosa TaxID=99300 RepID=A0ABR0UKD2_REHGL